MPLISRRSKAAPSVRPESQNGTGPIVSAIDLTKRYGEGDAAVDAVRGITVDFPRGRFAAIMGPSGSGKSTLMHVLAGLDRPTAGTVIIDGIELSSLDDRRLTDLRRDHIGFIFQSFNLLPVLDARENILLPLSIAGRDVDQAWFDQLVETIDIGDRLTHRPAELSGGQQQRVAVARALVSRPSVMFADEPTGNLDSHASQEVLDLLRRAVDDLGQTVVMVTHEPASASRADRLLVLADGRIVRDGEALGTDDILDLMKDLGSAG
jgi:putative ABC transport system ATP-binding protein